MTESSRLLEAREHIQARRFAAAMELLEPIPADDPTYLQAVKLMAHCARERNDWRLAESFSLTSLGLNGDNAADLFILSAALQAQRKFEEAYEAYLRLEPFVSDGKAQRRVLKGLAYCKSALGAHAEAEAVIRRAIGLFDDAVFHSDLAENLFQQKRIDEAAAAAEQAVALDAGEVRSRTLLNVLRHVPTENAARQRWTPWPGRASAFEDARAVIKSNLLRGLPEGGGFVTPETRFMALGSCFAGNLAKRLNQAGRNVFYEFIGEDVNSTYANMHFLHWVERGVTNDSGRLMEDAYGPELRQRYLEAARDSEVFVFTLGVAPCFFHPDTGEFFFLNLTGSTKNFLMNNFISRMTTVEENYRNLKEIIATIRRLSTKNPKIVLTVSPVPLAATAESPSAVIDDCISKSTLRLACNQVLKEDSNSGLHYWPSFEIVRWLGPYFGHMHPPVFGDQDGKTRHVSQWIVDIIIELFVQTYSEPGAHASLERISA